MQSSVSLETGPRRLRKVVLVTPYLLMPEGAEPPPGLERAAQRPEERPPEAPDGFECFVRALVEAALASGATRAAAVLRELFHHGRLSDAAYPPELIESLRARGVLDASSGAVSASFRKTALAWRAVLSGQSSDLAACGDSTLDAWASELLCAADGAPKARANEYRRELRRRGVAAFGLLAA